MLFCAARAELVDRVIAPALESGRDVVCDRFVDSTVAYQGGARGIGVGLVDGAQRRRRRAAACRTGRSCSASTRRPRSGAAEGRCESPISDRFEARGRRLPGPDRRRLRPDRRRRARADRRSSTRRGTVERGPRAGAGGARRSRRLEAGERRGCRTRSPPPRPSSRRPGRRWPRRCAAARPTPTASSARPGAARRAAARAFAAELLAAGAADPDDARRRALADPSPHPDLTWLRPPGNQHLVEEVRSEVIGGRRLPAVRGRAPGLRDRGRRRDGRGEPERAPEDARGAAPLRAPDPDHRRAGGAARDGASAAASESVRAARRPRRSAAARGRARRARRRDELEAARARSPAATSAAPACSARRPAREPARADAEACRPRRARRRARRRALGATCSSSRPRTASSGGRASSREAAAERAGEFGKGRDAQPGKREGDEAGKRADRRGADRGRSTSALGLIAAWYADVAAVARGRRRSGPQPRPAPRARRRRRGGLEPARRAQRRPSSRWTPAGGSGQRQRGARARRALPSRRRDSPATARPVV